MGSIDIFLCYIKVQKLFVILGLELFDIFYCYFYYYFRSSDVSWDQFSFELGDFVGEWSMIVFLLFVEVVGFFSEIGFRDLKYFVFLRVSILEFSIFFFYLFSEMIVV